MVTTKWESRWLPSAHQSIPASTLSSLWFRFNKCKSYRYLVGLQTQKHGLLFQFFWIGFVFLWFKYDFVEFYCLRTGFEQMDWCFKCRLHSFANPIVLPMFPFMWQHKWFFWILFYLNLTKRQWVWHITRDTRYRFHSSAVISSSSSILECIRCFVNYSEPNFRKMYWPLAIAYVSMRFRKLVFTCLFMNYWASNMRNVLANLCIVHSA